MVIPETIERDKRIPFAGSIQVHPLKGGNDQSIGNDIVVDYQNLPRRKLMLGGVAGFFEKFPEEVNALGDRLNHRYRKELGLFLHFKKQCLESAHEQRDLP